MAKNTRTKKKKKTESVCETLYSFVGSLSDVVISIYMVLILVAMPFYNEEGYVHIGTDKAMFFRRAAMVCGGILLPLLILYGVFKLVLFLQKKDISIKEYFKQSMSCTDYFVLLYGVAVVLSYVCSNYRDEAFWGATGWYMGMIPQLMLVFSYFVISKVWVRKNWLICMVLPVSAIVFVLGYLNRFGIYPFDMLVDNTSFISTIGNINWYCGYLTTVFFGGVFLLWKNDWKKPWQRYLLMAYVLIGFATLVTHGSSSGIVALAAVVFLLFCLSANEGKRMEAFWMEMCLFSAACLVTYVLRLLGILKITFVEGTVELFTGSALCILMTVVSVVGYIFVRSMNVKAIYPQKFFKNVVRVLCAGTGIVFVVYVVILAANTGSGGALLASTVLADSDMFLFSGLWGSRRGATWLAGINLFFEQNLIHKLFGVGPDCMSKALYAEGSTALLAMVAECFGEARLTNAHNEWITILVNEGILGLTGFAGAMITAMKRYLSGRENSLIAGACGCCLLAYTFNNIFSFQQSMGVSTMFIVLAVGENYLRGSKK